MTYNNHRYRKRRSYAGGIVSDTTHIANRLSWRGSLILGAILFILFYWVIPWWLDSLLNDQQDNFYRPIIEAFFTKRIHLVQWIGITLGLICVFIAIYNYFTSQHLSSSNKHRVSLLSRILSRLID